MKNIKKHFAKNGIFYTPKEDAEKLKKYIDIVYDEVYDPTCGQGNLLSVFDDDIKKYGQELDAVELEKAKELLCNFEGYAGDTLIDDKFKSRKFKLIMANPPFSIQWEPNPNDERFNVCPKLAPKSKADWAFNLHIIHHLADDGEAIVLNYPGTAYRGNAEKEIRKWFIDNNYIDKVVSYPSDTFVDTKISTILYVFKKNRTTTDVVFEDIELDKKEIVTVEQIVENNYNLTVGLYIEKEIIKEEVDFIELENQAEEAAIKKTIASMEITKLLCSIDGNYATYYNFVNRMYETIKKYKEDNGI